jgi:hypothetical protein
VTDQNQELREILRVLLAEVQHLRVDCAVLEARVSGKPSAVEILDIKKAAKTQIVNDHKDLVAKIDGLA